jgi:hypothetical protein
MFHGLGPLKTVLRGLEKEGGTQVRWNKDVCREVNGNYLGTEFFIQGVSVNWAILQHCFFWFGSTGADVTIAILLPTLKHCSCNGAMKWCTTCFCCESVLQKQ